MRSELELKEKYEQLYKDLVDSNDTENMQLLGSVMTNLMNRVIERDSDFAERQLEILESAKWHQYLTSDEAEELSKKLKKGVRWTYSVWESAMKQYELETEQSPYFNKYALWIVMNILYARHAETISQKILECSLEEATNEQLISVIYSLSVDLLKDDEDIFSIKDMLY